MAFARDPSSAAEIDPGEKGTFHFTGTVMVLGNTCVTPVFKKKDDRRAENRERKV